RFGRLPRRTLVRVAGLGACAALLTAIPAGAAPMGVTQVVSSSSTIAFDVDVPALSLTPVEGEDGVVRVVLDGYTLTGTPGSPAIPGRVLTVAIPPDGTVGVRVTGSDPVVRDEVTLAPVPAIAREDGSVSERSVRDPAAYAAARTGTGERGRLVQIGWI